MARKPKNLDTVVRKEPKKKVPRAKKAVATNETDKKVVETVTVSNATPTVSVETTIPVTEKVEQVTAAADDKTKNIYVAALVVAVLMLPVLVYLGIR